MANSATDFISAHLSLGMKTHAEYDGSNRLEFFYEAPHDLADQEKCMVTEYSYDGASNRVVNTKEKLGVWDASWDL